MIQLTKTSRASFHFWVYYSSLCLLVVSLPSSRFLITLSIIFLAANWLLEANFRTKFTSFFANKPALAFSFIFVFSLVGLVWTKNLPNAFGNDLLHRLPTLILPLVIATSPRIDRNKVLLLLSLFIASVLVVTLIGFTMRTLNPLIDFRKASPFVPNVYFNMMLLLAAFQLPMLIKQVSTKKFYLFMGIAVSVWFVVYVLYLRSLTGFASLLGVLLFTIIVAVYRQRSLLLKVVITSMFVILAGYSVWLLRHMYHLTHHEVETELSKLPTHTRQGNPYYHDPEAWLRENGHLVHVNISDTELERGWRSRSELDFNGNDLLGHSLKQTLYRYMSSKGLMKDEEGLMALADEDIRAIERSVTNHLYLDWSGMYIRLHQMMMGVYIYRETSNPTWSTLTERIDLWRASYHAFIKHPLLGWGTGSILDAMDYGLRKNNSVLVGLNMMPHNQYIFILLTLGLLGLAVYFAIYTYAIIKTRAYRHFIFNVFIIICAVTYLGNNSLEKQVGQSFFVFFFLFYLFIFPNIHSPKATSKSSSKGGFLNFR